jgi:hypothetical protein
MVFPYVAKPWHLLEMRLWGGVMLSTQLLLLVAPSRALLYRAGSVSDFLSLFFGLGGMSGGRDFMVGASGILLLGAGSGCSGGYSFSDGGRFPKGRGEGFVVGMGFVSSFTAYGGVGHSVGSVDFLG